MKIEALLLLASFAKSEASRILYEMIKDESECEEIRNHASIQLSVVGSFLKDPQPLVEKLLSDLESPDADLRLYATFALGWEGNHQAAIPLIGRLYDTDVRVQQNAVNALCNIRDDRILDMLLERLEHGPEEQKRAILFNLWRFYSKREEVKNVYLKYLEHENADLRFDALVLLGPLEEEESFFEEYRKCLSDSDQRIRRLALKMLAEDCGSRLTEIREEISALVDDPDMEIKRLAMNILKKVK
ncbi:MAG: HEAT repeat domain-containing protein [bacterium]|nr:HEAT repeat domain-containing protein [bacterium]